MWYKPTTHLEQVVDAIQRTFVDYLLDRYSYQELESMAQGEIDDNDWAQMKEWHIDRGAWMLCVETAMGRFDDEA